jgi:hypothetical protein
MAATDTSWIFDRVPASGARTGGLAQAHVFRSDIDAFVREVLQNARDQRRGGDSRARVRFRLSELTGSGLEEFLAAMGWNGLAPHVEAAAAGGFATISHRLRTSLDRLASGHGLRIMLIEDTATNGLTGGEDEVDSNFNALCRHILITSGERRRSGGSFGLGKSVLWNFSGFSTVLFSSRTEETPGVLVPRFFGRTQLPWHETAGTEWEGSGWFGERESRGGGERARSVLGGEAAAIERPCHLERPPETGTSILVVGFAEPAEEDQRAPGEICADIVASAARWFWPALVAGELEIGVEGVVDGETVFDRRVEPTEEVAPFVRALDFGGDPVEVLTEPGQVSERELTLEIPAQRHGVVENPQAATKGRVLLRVRMAEPPETELQNRIALQRGTGMVIDYHEPGRRVFGDQAFHAVLLAGTAHGSSAADRAVEEFLRSAEPPAHTEWTHTTGRVAAEYHQGTRKALDGLYRQMTEAVREMTRDQADSTDEGPDALRKLFPLPGVGIHAEPQPPYRLENTGAELEDSAWSFRGTYTRHRPGAESWRFRVRVLLDQESGGKGASLPPLPVESLASSGGLVRGPGPDGSWEVEVPAGHNRITFSGRTEPVSSLPPGAVHRLGVQLDVQPLGTPAGESP